MRREMNTRKRIFMEKYSIFLLVVMGLFAAVTGTVQAQEEQPNNIPDGGIQITPTKFVWTLGEGETKSGRVIVKNYSDEEQNVRMEVEDFYVEDDGTTPKLYVPQDGDEMKALDVIDWVTMPEPFTLAPGGVKSVEFTVRVPDDRPTNGYYGSILFKTGGGTDGEGSQIGLTYRIGALLIMAVQGDEPMVLEGEIQRFYPERKLFWETPAVLFAQVQNTGNMHYPMFGEIEIKRFGKMFHKIKMTPRLLYPIKKPTSYREIMEFQIWDFGRYTAHLSMHSENGAVQAEMDTSFWVIPWQLVVIVVIVLVVLWILGRLFKKYVHIGAKPQRSPTKKK